MPPQAGAARAVRLFFGLLFLVPALTVVFGIVFIVAGFRQSPHDRAAARAFAGDGSCGTDLTAAPSIGEGRCRVVDATVVRAHGEDERGARRHAGERWDAAVGRRRNGRLRFARRPAGAVERATFQRSVGVEECVE
jgi:hypothetical protein